MKVSFKTLCVRERATNGSARDARRGRGWMNGARDDARDATARGG